MNTIIGPRLRGGDKIFFWGTSFLSNGIKKLTHGPSHIAVVLDLDLPLPDGSKQAELHVIESTILGNQNGVQVNTLAGRIAGYDAGGCIASACLSDRVRTFLDWPALWAFAYSRLGNHYNVAEIAAYVANLALPAELAIDAPDSDSEVCSELGAELLRAGGMPGMDPFHTPPGRLWRMKMYEPSRLYTFTGAIPACDLRTFNTV